MFELQLFLAPTLLFTKLLPGFVVVVVVVVVITESDVIPINPFLMICLWFIQLVLFFCTVLIFRT